jgi:hypothetical protein
LILWISLRFKFLRIRSGLRQKFIQMRMMHVNMSFIFRRTRYILSSINCEREDRNECFPLGKNAENTRFSLTDHYLLRWACLKKWWYVVPFRCSLCFIARNNKSRPYHEFIHEDNHAMCTKLYHSIHPAYQ